MREILNGLNKVKYELVFIQGSDKDVATDKLLDEVSHMDKEYSDATEAHKLPVPKSKREHCITAIIKVIYALLRSVWLLIQIEPDLVITNGPGIAVPLCYAAAGMNAILATNIKLIYIESICRVEDLSFTGKLVHPVVHTLVVMWPQVARKWPRTKYFGTLERF
ncbi:UDP-N-acetylglucosamine transferase subunit ALG14 homolog [Babesia ovis]|uniref:UDP-N-acetylglucosamine transferase subunit ALG14 n=1 Tax=Babesia ovis TaxID=5869 RepID=A0A9W5T9B3_BABOV|nr:UDP-N-acetylglucosamine transferase subunit ALG14 homolog [Babesia ovis]